MKSEFQGQLNKLRFSLMATGFIFLSACVGGSPAAVTPGPIPFAGSTSLANTPSLPNELPAPGIDPEPDEKYKIHEEARLSEHITLSGMVSFPVPPPFKITIDGRVVKHTVTLSGAKILEDGRIIATEIKEVETPLEKGRYFRVRDVATDTCDFFALGEGGTLHATIGSTQEKPILEYILYKPDVAFNPGTRQQKCPPENFLGGTINSDDLVSDFRYPSLFQLANVPRTRNLQSLGQALDNLNNVEDE